jgi:hypothetical protein
MPDTARLILLGTTLFVFVATALLGVLHLAGLRRIAPPYDKWVLGTVVTGMVTAALHAAMALFNPAPPPAPAAMCSLQADSTAAFRQMEAGSCAGALHATLRENGWFRDNDPALADALAHALPARGSDETELHWRQRVADAIAANPLLATLHQRAEDESAPFVSLLLPVAVSVPADRRPPAGTVYVSDPALDKRYIRLFSRAGGCSLVLRAETRITGLADADPPLMHINVQQLHYLFGSQPGRDSLPAHFALAPGDSSADLLREGGNCYTAD